MITQLIFYVFFLFIFLGVIGVLCMSAWFCFMPMRFTHCMQTCKVFFGPINQSDAKWTKYHAYVDTHTHIYYLRNEYPSEFALTIKCMCCMQTELAKITYLNTATALRNYMYVWTHAKCGHSTSVSVYKGITERIRETFTHTTKSIYVYLHVTKRISIKNKQQNEKWKHNTNKTETIKNKAMTIFLSRFRLSLFLRNRFCAYYSLLWLACVWQTLFAFRFHLLRFKFVCNVKLNVSVVDARVLLVSTIILLTLSLMSITRCYSPMTLHIAAIAFLCKIKAYLTILKRGCNVNGNIKFIHATVQNIICFIIFIFMYDRALKCSSIRISTTTSHWFAVWFLRKCSRKTGKTKSIAKVNKERAERERERERGAYVAT